jgi:hypothetical protein
MFSSYVPIQVVRPVADVRTVRTLRDVGSDGPTLLLMSTKVIISSERSPTFSTFIFHSVDFSEFRTHGDKTRFFDRIDKGTASHLSDQSDRKFFLKMAYLLSYLLTLHK